MANLPFRICNLGCSGSNYRGGSYLEQRENMELVRFEGTSVKVSAFLGLQDASQEPRYS